MWEVAERGEGWESMRNVPEEGAIVALESSLAMYERRYPKGKVHSLHNIRLVGEEGCGKIVLAIWTRQSKSEVESRTSPKQYTTGSRRWFEETNVLTSTKQHFGSSGTVRGFGLYGSPFHSIATAENGSSLQSFATDRTWLGNKYREQLFDHVCAAKKNVESIFLGTKGRSVVTSGTILSEALFEAMYDANPELKLQHPKLSQWWWPAAFVCLDAYTEIEHTERDLTYTLLHVPRQRKRWQVSLQYDESTGTVFNFYLNEGLTIKVPMKVGVTIFYSAFFLKHRQTSSGKPLVNIAVYGNQKIFQFGKKTLERNLVACAGGSVTDSAVEEVEVMETPEAAVLPVPWTIPRKKPKYM